MTASDRNTPPLAVVTGAASGIGAALVVDLLSRGYRCVAVDLDDHGLAELASRLDRDASERLVVERADVSAPDDLLGVAARIAASPVDLLFNNAGVVFNSVPLWETPPAASDWVFDVNVHGVLNGIRAFVPAMIAAGRGTVVNVASLGGFHVRSVPGWRQGLYSASKAAVFALSEALEQEVEGTGVRVSVVAPGAVRTRIADPGSPLRFGVDATTEFARTRIQSGGDAGELAAEIVDRVLAGEFLVFVGSEDRAMIRERHHRIEQAALR
ncbi:hypothetical protein ASD65_10510 [Microbacterium sp. Root61]|uniref:SDR family NAD(P)-dependent oxidoreductase n=1 Tax=Microbacterium sp. Root61 TaxID=1736570 RepID=UPI0006F3E0AC|nr:SDR family NAD(P)-dependent oxidoreductase [Microbacterium sp. Root61]KRA24806.1 hypothetical protein ASD65_10510 [Microbacterium sp. Root61]